jgi:hypothetical protein
VIDRTEKERQVKRRLHAAALVAVMAVTGCISIPVAATVATQPGRLVTAEASKFSILWLTPLPVETASQLVDDLLEQCGGAGLTGVTVATQTAWAFVGQQEKMIASGYCVEPD